jgi:hypothetical protein
MLQSRTRLLTSRECSGGLGTSFVQAPAVLLLTQVMIYMRCYFVDIFHTTLAHVGRSCCVRRIASRWARLARGSTSLRMCSRRHRRLSLSPGGYFFSPFLAERFELSFGVGGLVLGVHGSKSGISGGSVFSGRSGFAVWRRERGLMQVHSQAPNKKTLS